MKYKEKYYHCSKYLKDSLKQQIDEVFECVEKLKWEGECKAATSRGRGISHQAAYNRLFEQSFKERGWETHPLLTENPRLIGDFRKHLVFVEIQFGNSSTLYRDYYKFQYGLANGLLSLAVLIVPDNPHKFFPTRPNSISNMAEFKLADRYLTQLPINVPTLLIGLLSENT